MKAYCIRYWQECILKAIVLATIIAGSTLVGGCSSTYVNAQGNHIELPLKMTPQYHQRYQPTLTLPDNPQWEA